MFRGSERILIFRTLKFFQAAQDTYSAISLLNFNEKAIIVHSEKAVQKKLFSGVQNKTVIL